MIPSVHYTGERLQQSSLFCSVISAVVRDSRLSWAALTLTFPSYVYLYSNFHSINIKHSCFALFSLVKASYILKC